MEQLSLFDQSHESQAADVFSACFQAVDPGTPLFERCTIEVVGSGEVVGRMYFRGSDEYVPISTRIQYVSD